VYIGSILDIAQALKIVATDISDEEEIIWDNWKDLDSE